jgi:DNA repair photolyase
MFRLALADREPLERTAGYLADVGIPTSEFLFSAATETRRVIFAVRTQKRWAVEAIESLIQWPAERSEEWTRGFLAGIYDAEGHLGQVVRISNADPVLLREIAGAFGRLGFRAVVEPARLNGVCNVRLLGGLPETMRFILMVDPATARKRDITGRAMKGTGARQVVSIEPLGLDLPMFDITTGTGDFVADGVVSHNCFARPTHEYLGMNTGEDFDRKIVVKINAVERVRAELAPGRWAGDHVAMGTNTDPYQRCEGKYHLTQGIVAELSAAANPFSILTKSTLILRDLDLLAEAARRTDVRANFSIGTLDEDVWRMTEPGTPHPRRRIEAVARLNAAGVPCGVLVAPVLPGLSDAADQLEEVVKACVEAGAVSITPLLLHLRPGVREHYLGWLAGARPDLMERYAGLYPRAYAPAKTQDELATTVRELVGKHGGRSAGPRQTRSVRPPAPAPAAPAVSQLQFGV